MLKIWWNILTYLLNLVNPEPVSETDLEQVLNISYCLRVDVKRQCRREDDETIEPREGCKHKN